MSDLTDLSVWQVAQGLGAATIAGFAAAALRLASILGGRVALAEKAIADQQAINIENGRLHEKHGDAMAEIKESIAKRPDREEMRAMFGELRGDLRDRAEAEARGRAT
jgi:hypothetical protein